MCKSCSTKKTYTIKDLNEWAKQKEGECLSDKYIDSAYKYQWKCKLGHTWFANWNNVRNKNQWCNECASLKMSQDRLGFTIEDLQNFAKNKGGECLSTEYVGIKTKYTWKCKCGNIWDAKWGHVKQKSWCPECAKKQRAKNRIQNGNDNINTLKDFAKSKGGECLSTEYLGVEAKYLWKCEHQHEWYASWYSLKKLNTWCPSCNLTRYTIEDLQNFAKDKGGECLSTEYIGVKTKYTWKCNEGHTWNKTWDSMVNKNSWCPKCASFKYLNESRVRFILEKLLDASFNSNKELFPPYILDGYNHNLNLAFEYNGIQHYENVKHFHKSNNKDLKSQIKRDNTIIDLCKKNNINLLIVPY
jgi:thiol-disulfide isomerase/thioredoxin